jgi:hypothetical protein
MLGRLVLILLQIAVGWFVGPLIVAKLPAFGQATIFITAVVFAILVWLTGFLGALVLKDVAQPTPATLTVAVVGALIGAGLTLVPQVTGFINDIVRGVPTLAYPLAGAVLGYAVKR